jgi:hypothetical protein
MNTEQISKEKAAAIMNFVDLMIGAFEANFVDTNELTLAQLHRIAENHCLDTFGVQYGNIIERHGKDLANRCAGQAKE